MTLKENITTQTVTSVSAKVLIVGDSGVGKTALLIRLQDEAFQLTASTHGASLSHIEVPRDLINDESSRDITRELELWDLAGQPRFESVRAGFYRGARGGLLLYDVTRRRTFLNVDNWKEEAFKNLTYKIPLILVANKVDLEDSRVVTTEEGEKYAKKNKMMYVESSALTGENVEEAYANLCRTMIESSKNSAQTKSL
ncbi:MAG: Rab family GTPase [Promethearchaeota archaeon]